MSQPKLRGYQKSGPGMIGHQSKMVLDDLNVHEISITRARTSAEPWRENPCFEERIFIATQRVPLAVEPAPPGKRLHVVGADVDAENVVYANEVIKSVVTRKHLVDTLDEAFVVHNSEMRLSGVKRHGPALPALAMCGEVFVPGGSLERWFSKLGTSGERAAGMLVQEETTACVKCYTAAMLAHEGFQAWLSTLPT